MAIALSGGHLQVASAESPEDLDLFRDPEFQAAAAPKEISFLAAAPAPVPAVSLNDHGIGRSGRLATMTGEGVAASSELGTPDTQLIRESFAHVAASSTPAMEYFYARLFVRYPEMRSMFPHSMQDHMERVFTALEHVVWNIDSPGMLTKCLQQLGGDHRKFGVRERHYEAFFSVLADTIRHFCGHYWTDRTQAAWEGLVSHAGSVMMAAARRDATVRPPWWIGEVVQHDRRGPDLAVLTIRPDQPLHYLPGQYLSVQVPRWPRVWRNFSVANAPRQNGLIDLHVRAVPGGMVSGSLVHNSRPGDTVLLGQPRGDMTVPEDGEKDMLCIAGGTGLAPIKAIIEAVIGASRPGSSPKIGLLYGARTEQALYDLPDLRMLESGYPRLLVVPVVSDDPGFTGVRGTLPGVAARYARCEGKDILVSGPAAMVRATVSALAGRVSADSIRHDPPDAMR